MRLSLFILCIAGWVTICNAQNKKKKPQSFDEFRKEINDEFNNFRREITEDYIDFVRDPWKSFASEPPVKKPEEKPVEPLVIPENDIKHSLAYSYNFHCLISYSMKTNIMNI